MTTHRGTHSQIHTGTGRNAQTTKCTDICTDGLLVQCYYILIKKKLLSAGRDTHIFRHRNIHIYLYLHTQFVQTTVHTQIHTVTHSLSLSQGYMVVASHIFSQRRSVYLCLRWFHPFCISSPLQTEPFSAREHKRQNGQWSSRGRPSEPVNEDKWSLPSSLSFVFAHFISACPPHFSFHYFCLPPSRLFSTSNSPFIFLMTPAPSLPIHDICLLFLVISSNQCYFLSHHSFIRYLHSLPLFLSAGQLWDASLEEEVVRLGWFLSVLLQRWVFVQEEGVSV